MNRLARFKNAARNNVRRFAAKASVAATGALASGLALAQTTTLADTAATAITGASAEVQKVQSAVIGVLVVIVIFLFIKSMIKK